MKGKFQFDIRQDGSAFLRLEPEESGLRVTMGFANKDQFQLQVLGQDHEDASEMFEKAKDE